MAGFDEQPLWDALPVFLDQVEQGAADPFQFVTPPAEPLGDYSSSDIALLERAAEGFRPDAFGGKKLKQVLKESSSPEYGRVPLGLLMIAGYGICNAIVEVDATLETFDYAKYNIVEQCKFPARMVQDQSTKTKGSKW